MTQTQRVAMNRRGFIGGLGCLLAGLPSAGAAQPGDFFKGRWIDPSRFWRYWPKIPSIVIVSEPDDLRLPAVHEAVHFWNDVFLSLGSPFRLGSVTHIAEMTLEDDSRRGAHRVVNKLLKADDRASLSAFAKNMDGDVIVALSDGVRSFAGRSRNLRKVLVVIRSFAYQSTPPSAPSGGLMVNTIAHELGHAIGLDHNDGTRTLMCHPCYFEAMEGFAPLTDEERRLLLEIYPPNWRAAS
jgi:hypothetical protein